MPLSEAIRRGLVRGSNDEIRNAITAYYEKAKRSRRAVMEYSTTKVRQLPSKSYGERVCSDVNCARFCLTWVLNKSIVIDFQP